MPCSANDISISPPSGPSGPAIPGFGVPFALPLPNLSIIPDGFPEDLLDLLDRLQLLIPPGALKPALNPNFGKDVFDAIMKLLDQFFPFLMLYKFFLPILNMIICIIEVLCALTNPFKLISALKRLFTVCIPEFLNLFPIFALIIMIISLLLLLLALIEYIILQILKLIEALLMNINALFNAFQQADEKSVLAIAHKLGSLLCVFQNLFVLLSIFAIIIQIIKDILSLVFNIPPCQDGDEEDDSCCSPDVCPIFIKNGPYTRTTGTLQYLPKVGAKTDVELPAPFNNLNFDIRQETWQIYDTQQTEYQEFINIINAHDIMMFPKPVFFPTDSIMNEETDYRQAPYTVDVKVFYDPTGWSRIGTPRYIVFKNCVVLTKGGYYLYDYQNSKIFVKNGVLKIAGGQGYEEDGITQLNGFNEDGSPGDFQATLNNFLHLPDNYDADPQMYPTDGKLFNNVEYTFKPNSPALVGRGLISAGCDPALSASRMFVSNVSFGDIGIKTQQLKDILDGPNFPNINSTQECLSTALTTLRNDLTPSGVANFKATTDICLQDLKDKTKQSLTDLIGVGFDAAKSDFTVKPKIQFTTKPILVNVNLREKNGIVLTNGMDVDVASDLASRIEANITFGEITSFNYDTETQSFAANITSEAAGKGEITVSFDKNVFVKDIIPENLDESPSRVLQKLEYQFIYAGADTGADGDGMPRRDERDLANEVSGNGSR